MRNPLLLILVIIVMGCQPNQKRSNHGNTQIHLVNFLKKKIHLPENYVPVTLDEAIEGFEQLDSMSLLHKVHYTSLKEMKEEGIAHEMFVDVNDIKNFISFTEGEYLPLEKGLVNVYVNLLEREIIPMSLLHDFELTRLESKYIGIQNSNAIKVKYEQTLEGTTRYMTQYLITSKFKTFLMIVNHEKNEDYQFVLNNFAS